MSALHFLLTVLIVSVSAGCVGIEHNAPDSSLEPGNGVLLMRIHATDTTDSGTTHLTEKPLAIYHPFIAYGKVGATASDGQIQLDSGPDLKVIKLPAGKYEWKFVHYQTALYINHSDFEIADGQLTYIGDLYIDFNTSGGRSTKTSHHVWQ